MNINNWNLIRIFLTVAETGSLSHASTTLSMSQPTVGRYINELETITGLTLFVRGRSGMELSEAGMNLIDEARAMSAEANRFTLKVAGSATNISGTVRITASEVVATHLLPEILCELKNAEPEIDIELIASNTVDNLLSRDADIAIRMFRPTQNDLIARKVNDFSMGIYATKTYLDQFGYPKNISDLMHHRMVGYDRDDYIITHMKQFGIQGHRDMFTFRTDDQVVYWELVKAGAGIGFYPNSIAGKTPHILSIPLEEIQIPPLPMWLTAHQELRTNQRIRRTMDFLHQALKALPL